MSRIPIRILQEKKTIPPYFTFSLQGTLYWKIPCPERIVNHTVEFRVDTGACHTTLLYRDFQLISDVFGFGYDALQLKESDLWSFGIAGIRIPTYRMKVLAISFVTKDCRELHIPIESVEVLEPSAAYQDIQGMLPSLLGMDVLRHFAIKFLPSFDTAYLKVLDTTPTTQRPDTHT